jgi:hypothetical protein
LHFLTEVASTRSVDIWFNPTAFDFLGRNQLPKSGLIVREGLLGTPSIGRPVGFETGSAATGTRVKLLSILLYLAGRLSDSPTSVKDNSITSTGKFCSSRHRPASGDIEYTEHMSVVYRSLPICQNASPDPMNPTFPSRATKSFARFQAFQLLFAKS